MRRSSRSGALIAAYFDHLEPSARTTVQALQQAVLAAAPELEQTLKWGNLCFQLEGRTLVAIATHKLHASLQFFNGVVLAQQYPVLEGTNRNMRQMKWRYSQPVDQALVRELVEAAVRIGSGVGPGDEA